MQDRIAENRKKLIAYLNRMPGARLPMDVWQYEPVGPVSYTHLNSGKYAKNYLILFEYAAVTVDVYKRQTLDYGQTARERILTKTTSLSPIT